MLELPIRQLLPIFGVPFRGQFDIAASFIPARNVWRRKMHRLISTNANQKMSKSVFLKVMLFEVIKVKEFVIKYNAVAFCKILESAFDFKVWMYSHSSPGC